MSQTPVQEQYENCDQKQRSTNHQDSWEKEIVSWISNTGTIHPYLTFSSTDRSVRITNDVPQKTVLMNIPISEYCLTIKTLNSTEYGRRLVGAIEQMKNELSNDTNDLLLALYLAQIPNDHLRPYLATLPTSESYDTIPRRWSEDKLSSLLGGTMLLKRSRDDKNNLKRDYETIVNSLLRNCDITSEKPFPSFEKFDDMFAAVSSRAFAGLGSDDCKMDAMVPLLDLLDHRRGVGGKKDVRYKRCVSTERGVTTAAIEVVADRDLSAGSILHDTYGAKGNAQLLSRYGFCIENNIEPDGSSNDVVEFIIKPGKPAVELRAGPKSYTYGGFVKALELFLDEEHEENSDDDGNDDTKDDIEAFLEMDEEEESGGFGMMYGDNMDDNEGEEEDETQSIKAECLALEKLSFSLESTRQGYSLKGTTLQDTLKKNDYSPEHCSAILVHSEMRTLLLFKLAADKIRWQLQGGEEGDKTMYKQLDDTLLTQIDELVAAYGAIRHGGLISECSNTATRIMP